MNNVASESLDVAASDLAAADVEVSAPGRFWRAMQALFKAMEKSHRRRLLQTMPDYLLKDMGISRCEIDAVVEEMIDGRPDPTRRQRLGER